MQIWIHPEELDCLIEAIETVHLPTKRTLWPLYQQLKKIKENEGKGNNPQ